MILSSIFSCDGNDYSIIIKSEKGVHGEDGRLYPSLSLSLFFIAIPPKNKVTARID